jgi:hypothetical protein
MNTEQVLQNSNRERVAALLYLVQEFSSATGIKFGATRPETMDRLLAMDIDKLDKIISNFSNYKKLIQSSLETDPDCLKDESLLLNQIGQFMNLRVTSDLLGKIQHDDIVEIYNQDFVQVYRGLTFMHICNYTLVDLLTYEFYELYERSVSVNEHLFAAAKIVTERGTSEGVSLKHVPAHLTRERFSEERGVFQITFRHFFPIYLESHDFFGYLVVLRARPYAEPDLKTDKIQFI